VYLSGVNLGHTTSRGEILIAFYPKVKNRKVIFNEKMALD